MKPSISGRRISSCRPIQAPNEYPPTQHRLQIVERGGGVGKFAHAVVENALAAADAAKVEAQHAKALRCVELIKLDGNPILHGPASARVPMENKRDRRAFFGRFLVTAFHAPCGAWENHFRHSFSTPEPPGNAGG